MLMIMRDVVKEMVVGRFKRFKNVCCDKALCFFCTVDIDVKDCGNKAKVLLNR